MRLALRLARAGQRIVLVERPAGYRVVPLERRGDVQIFGRVRGAALFLARERR